MLHKSPDPSASPALLQSAREGNREALDLLLAPYWEVVHRLAYRITRQAEDAEDLTQEAFVRIIRRLPAYRGECAFGTWVYRVALNVCLTARSRRRAPSAPLDAVSIADPAPGPEAVALHAELEERLRGEVMRLRPVHREAVLLRLFAELSYEEMAEVLGTSVNAVRLRVHRGMARLRERLRPWLTEEGPL